MADTRFTLTAEQAAAAWQILIEECHASTHEIDRYSFIHYVTTEPGRTKEYRFQGSLGFGGKFRLNSNRDFAPHVDCYREDETPKRRAAINRANARLLALVGGAA